MTPTNGTPPLPGKLLLLARPPAVLHLPLNQAPPHLDLCLPYSNPPAALSHLRVMLAVPTSPEVENLMPSLVAEMLTVSPMLARSLMMRWYSADGSCASAENLLQGGVRGGGERG